jgi:hypothetical protein
VLHKILNLNTGGTTPGKDPADLYKVLILDRSTKDVIAPLLRVGDLRKLGVTLHLLLDTERQPIPDVAAVYLVAPSAANIERIVADAAAGLYDTMHLNFTTALPGKLMEQLATGVVKADAAKRVAKLHDQYVSFIALEPNLFSLNMPDAYVQLNDPSAQDSQIEVGVGCWVERSSAVTHAHAVLLLLRSTQAVVGAIVDGLFSVCVTLGVVPVIRCPRGGVAEHVASLLDGKLRCGRRMKRGGCRAACVSEVWGGAAPITLARCCVFALYARTQRCASCAQQSVHGGHNGSCGVPHAPVAVPAGPQL